MRQTCVSPGFISRMAGVKVVTPVEVSVKAFWGM
jgi:hypothetical protein